MSKITWDTQAYSALLAENYEEVVRIYEQFVEAEPEAYSHYWHLGLAYLLLSQEELAQSTWLLVFMEAAPEETDRLTSELASLLEIEAQRQQALSNKQLAWLIRGHIRELVPGQINNLLHLIQLAIQLQIFKPENLIDWQVIESLDYSGGDQIELALLWKTIKQVLGFPVTESFTFAKVGLKYLASFPDIGLRICQIATKVALKKHQFIFAVEMLEEILKVKPRDTMVLHTLISLCDKARRYSDAVEYAKQVCELSTTISGKTFSNLQLITTSINASQWLELDLLLERYKVMLHGFLEQPPLDMESLIEASLLGLSFPMYYLQDNPQETRFFANKIGEIFQDRISNAIFTKPSMTGFSKTKEKLRIGYISQSLRQHSIGWLSRWLFKYHDRDTFDISLYLIDQKIDKMTETWFQANSDRSYDFTWNSAEIATQIDKDSINILVDLDSITNNSICQVMALKPAPIQITWLGYDASGIPAIDYFIGDAYVLPDKAQLYYSEKIWRLPSTYVAVDGFEVGIPTLSREQLDISADQIIYFNQQNAKKCNPKIIYLQMQILKEVKNSYLLIKGFGDRENIQSLFGKIAEEVGVNPDRLRFLGTAPHEIVHRANMQIADVVLDTYPYNGATTTLEVLWLGIPLVTRVGEQFAARNSYAFMTNAGLTEGIAWTDEEYVEWGIRFGQDPALRDRVTLKLRESRRTSPLWNAQQFTRDMEAAYQQMWAKYLARE